MRSNYRYVEWDENNIWKNEIKQNVTSEEIEQCFNNPPFIIVNHKRHKDRRVLFGKTLEGRYLFTVFQHIDKDTAHPIDSRDMMKQERSFHEKQTKKN
tara:strand:- start:2467 stop:2760 length:294 start_codon:yes stop_codon:yes gene_type:complete